MPGGLRCIGFRVDGSTAVASVATAIPSREPKHLQRLLADKAAALDPGFGFDAFALEASWAESLSSAQESLVEEPSGEREVARLVDRLTVKLGSDKVRRPQPHESHLPERASGWRPALGQGREGRAPAGAAPAAAAARPAGSDRRHLRDARRQCRGASSGGARCTTSPASKGPSGSRPNGGASGRPRGCAIIIASRTSDGRRYWIYREGVIGDGRGGLPEWYIHGLFG